MNKKGCTLQSLNLYIDDIRNPPNLTEWIVVRSSEQAINYVKENGMPNFASFDHDLGGDDTSMVFLKWLIDYDMDNKGQIIPSDFSWTIHSANPVGKDNIDSLLKAYMKFKLLKS